MITSSIVLYCNNPILLRPVFESIFHSTIDYLILIDNSPTNDLKELVTNYPSNRYSYIYNNANLGYGSAHNIAIKKSLEMGSKYHIIINPDIHFCKNTVENLERFMDENVNCGLVMPKILYPDGGVQYLCKLLPTPMDLFGRRFFPVEKWITRNNEKYELRFTGYDKIMKVPSLSGCFMFIRASVLERIGGFDERFFMYAEDIDLCRRIGEISHTIFNPDIIVYHEYEKGSYKNFKLLVYHISSVVKYFNKWGWIFDKKRKRINYKCLKQFIDPHTCKRPKMTS